MKKWTRARYQVNLPLNGGPVRVTANAEHRRLAREAGCEGMVLLKNDNCVLPLEENARLALFGKGVFDYVKGGGGSGDVTVEKIYNLYDGLKLHERKTEIFEPLADYYRKDVQRQYEEGGLPGLLLEPELPDDLLQEASSFTDTAVIVISRFSGEGWDRLSVPYAGADPNEAAMCVRFADVYENGDFCLTNAEAEMVEKVTGAFSRVIVVLNIGGIMDTSWFAGNDRIHSVLLAWQGGMEGGFSMADLLLGVRTPSGKLPDTLADRLESYPSTEAFHISPDYVEYFDDIYVGYRYFETVPGAAQKVVYPFGYGLSYTSFAIEALTPCEKDGDLIFPVRVTNTGEYPGKEVVQLYFSAPQGLLGKPSRQLIAFRKTKDLQPGEYEDLLLTFPISAMASYDDLGRIQKSAFVLEQGVYRFYLGGSVRDAKELTFSYGAAENIITEQCTARMVPSDLPKRMRADGTFEELPAGKSHDRYENAIGWEGARFDLISPAVRAEDHRVLFTAPAHIMLDDVADGKVTLEKFMNQLSLDDMIHLLGGQPNTGTANTFGYGNIPEFGIPNIMTADGPAGLRFLPECEVCTTAWPIASQLCSSWNPELLFAVGRAAAEEVKENNCSVWLAPAVNIHRSPLCGRNFEYYSEDPFLTGKLAASLIRGVQSQGIAAEVKHFCCNNKETNRKNSDSRVSERALREIYLKQFEIIVKESQPWALMTAYNLINGQRASENRELLEDILRGEWGFEGVVSTDWWTWGEHYKETIAGNDIKMGTGFPERLRKAYEIGAVSEEQIRICARRVLELILKVD